MPLDLNGPRTTEALKDAETEITFEGTTGNNEERAAVEITHRRRRWSVSAIAEWARGHGAKITGRGKVKL